MRRTDQHNRTWHKAGFTLVEVILVVGILIALLGLSVVAVSNYVVDLRQKEMDSKAEIIYFAAQNRLAILRANGNEKKYQEGTDAKKLGMIPLDAGDDSPLTEESLHYVTSESAHTDVNSIAAQVLPNGTVSVELWDSHWIIEFDMTNGSVYSVFYSEKSLSYEPQDLQELRVRKIRQSKTSGHVGYYGGEVDMGENMMSLNPHISIVNQEKLSVTFQCLSPDYSELKFKVTVTDAFGTSMEFTDLPVQSSGRNYEYTWVMDDLSSEETIFSNIFIEYQRDEFGNILKDEKGQNIVLTRLMPGTDITISLEVFSENPLIEPARKVDHTNSLFAYDPAEGMFTAVIQYGRHLQNLNAVKSLASTISNAVQKRDISFRDNPSDDTDWYSTYGDKKFDPICPNELFSHYNGCYKNNKDQSVQTVIHGLTTQTSGYSGLFYELYDVTCENIHLIAPQVTATEYAGALVGRLKGTSALINCGVFLDETRGDLTGKDEDSVWIQAPVAGGLVGFMVYNKAHLKSWTVTIENCFAAINVRGADHASGLVGLHRGDDLIIQNSYADCYLSGKNTAGLVVAEQPVTVKNCYAAGYQTPGEKAAGLVLGTGQATINNSYSGVFYKNLENKTIYPVGQNAVSTDVFYLYVDENYTDHTGATAMSFADLSDRTEMVKKLGDAFTAVSQGSRPYKLAGQGLVEYDYPWLKNMPHYGDWEAEFRTGELCYYEQYSDGYGFYGGGIDALASSGNVLGDGYGFVYTAPVENDIVYNGSQTLSKNTYYTVKHDGRDYYIYPLPAAAMNGNPSGQFYTEIYVHNSDGDKYFYYNPHFAWCIAPAQQEAPDILRIRSARQLNLLSQFYADYYRDMTQGATFLQEMDVSYNAYLWTQYGYANTVNEQGPIGSLEYPFQAAYNGGHHKIHNLNIRAEAAAIGLFGAVAPGGSLNNIVLVHDYDGATGLGGKLNFAGGIMSPGQYVAMGALVGQNDGIVTNCAVSGYNTQLNVYYGSTVYLGGLVGRNTGDITNSSVVTIGTTLNVNNSTAYVGGFVGNNTGVINRCYTLGACRVEASKSSVTVMSGFAGLNNMGTILNSYCATSLVAAGSATPRAFAPVGGLVGNTCRYLNAGTYELAGNLYAFQTEQTDSDGHPMTYAALCGAMPGFGTAVRTEMADNTSASLYPFPAVVTDGAQLVHYGDWILQVTMGDKGLFYWEMETGGSNAGVHISYLGTDGTYGSNLCTSHEDGGAVTGFGYGYYYKDGVTVSDGSFAGKQRNDQISGILSEQMVNYTFVAFNSGAESDQLRPEGGNANLDVMLDGTAYVISPFFADALQLKDNTAIVYKDKDYAQTPGTEANPYSIRAAKQLQFINWNWEKENATTAINGSNVSYTDGYPYLRHFWDAEGMGGHSNDDIPNTFQNYWQQSHDLDFTSEAKFEPIGGLFDRVIAGASSQVTMAFFAGKYAGNDYTIKNLSINTQAACIGLFGVTMGAELRNIVLYSDNNSRIENQQTDLHASGSNWYTLGGLVGFAGAGGENSKSVIENCSVAGYIIQDNRTENGAWGGGNIGGLVGSTNMTITGCSAVNTIIINIGFNGANQNVRVGGLVGCTRGTIVNCYAGGSIESWYNIDGSKNATYKLENGASGAHNSVSIWVGGIVGGVVIRNQGNFTKLVGAMDKDIVVENCYSYVALPKAGERNIKTVQSIASIGEMSAYFGELKNIVDGAEVVIDSQIQVINCYAYKENSLDALDYGKFKDYTSLNGNYSEEYDLNNDNKNIRYTAITNSHSPYVTYEEMTNGTLLTYLGAAFGKITDTENGAPIPGKYTFPGGDESLIGRDYPFPTVLTQENRFGMNEGEPERVNVHYGAWPKTGLYWESYDAELDLLADPTITVVLTAHSSTLDLEALFASQTEDNPLFAYTDKNGDPIAEASSPAKVTAVVKDENGNWRITLTPYDKGNVYITPNVGGQKNSLFVTVTADVLVEADPNPVILLGNDTKTTLLKAGNKNGQLLTAGTCYWTIEPLADDTIAEMNGAMENMAAPPEQTVRLSGIQQGDTFFRVSVTYELDEQRRYTGICIVHLLVVDGFLGLSDNDAQFNEVHMTGVTVGAYKPKDQFDAVPSLPGAPVFLYTNADAEELTLQSVKVTDADGNALTVQSAVLGPTTQDINGYYYRPLDVDAQTEAPVDLEVVIRHGKVNYTLHLKGVSLGVYHKVTVNHNDGLGTTTVLSVRDGDTLAGKLPLLTRDGYEFAGWNPAEDTAVTADLTLEAQWKKRHTVSFDANGGDSTPDPIQVTDGQPLGALPVITKGTMTVSGWTHNGQAVTKDTLVTADMVLVAQWGITIHLDADGGKLPDGVSETITVTDVSQLPKPKYEVSVMGYTWEHQFLYWEDQYGNEVKGTATLSNGMELKAVWKFNNVFVVDNRNGGSQAPYAVAQSESGQYIISGLDDSSYQIDAAKIQVYVYGKLLAGQDDATDREYDYSLGGEWGKNAWDYYKIKWDGTITINKGVIDTPQTPIVVIINN